MMIDYWMLFIKRGLPDDVWLLVRLPDVLALYLLMFFALTWYQYCSLFLANHLNEQSVIRAV